MSSKVSKLNLKMMTAPIRGKTIISMERTVSSNPVLAVPVVGAWIAVLLMLPAAAALLERRRFGFGRASPALLQRFLS